MIRTLKNVFTSLSRTSQRAPLVIAASAAAALGCSGSDESVLLASEGYADTRGLLSPEEHEAEFERLQEASLSLEEMTAVEGLLHEQGTDMSEVSFSGRLVVMGDAYLDVDSLLGPVPDAEGETQKGRTFSLPRDANNVPIPNNTEVLPREPFNPPFTIAPVLFSQIFNGQYQFMRPDIQNISIVVPNGAAASFLVGLFQQVVANVVGAADDCLTGMTVRTQAQYDALIPEDKVMIKPIFVRYGSSVCLNPGATTNACAIYPRKETREFDINFSQTRLVPGNRLGVISSRISPTKFHGKTCINPADCTKYNVGILTHELLHTLGLAHPNEPSAVRVIGTTDGSFNVSVMQGFCEGNCLFAPALSADDKDTIDTLFSPQGNQGCGWRDGVKAIAAVP